MNRSVWRADWADVCLARIAAVALLGMLLVGGMFVWSRRLAGALDGPPSSVALCAAGPILALAAIAIRLLLRLGQEHSAPIAAWQPVGLPRTISFSSVLPPTAFLPTIVLVVLATALSIPGASVGPLAFFWLCNIAEEGSFGYWTITRRTRHRAARRASTKGATPDGSKDLSRAVSESGEVVTQEIIRALQSDGQEVLRGSLRIVFEPGERIQAAHVAFCPPFVMVPRFDFRQSAGPSARIKVSQLLAYGVRLELKLNSPAAARSIVRIEILANSRQGPDIASQPVGSAS